jgi:Cyclin
VLSRLLEVTVGRNEKRAPTTGPGAAEGPRTLFCGTRAPAVALDAYLSRIFRYANCSPACYVLAFIYLERLVEADAGLRITALSVHRLISTCVLVATKFLDDSYYNNSYFAKIVGISLTEMNALELELLGRIDFRLHVQPEEFDAVCQRLVDHLSEDELLAAAEELEVGEELRNAQLETALTASA